LNRHEDVSIEQTHHSVFVSYAREDRDWATVATNLLNAGGATVFTDVREIAVGDRWQNVLKSTLQPVERVLVFWSRHAATSGWVQQECRIALRNGKRVVLVPMDDTPLSSLLWQSRALTGLKSLLQQGATKASQPPAESSSAIRPAVLAGSAGMAALVALFFLISPIDPAIIVSNLNGGGADSAPILQNPDAVWVLVAGALATLASLVWLVMRRVRKEQTKQEIRKRLDRYISQQSDGETTIAPAIDGGLGRRVVDMVFDDRSLTDTS
jgi:hypothetical protein